MDQLEFTDAVDEIADSLFPGEPLTEQEHAALWRVYCAGPGASSALPRVDVVLTRALFEGVI